MGDYTRFKFSAHLKPDAPKEVIEAIQLLLSEDDDNTPTYPTHPFFQDSRRTLVLMGGSAYFDTPEPPIFEEKDGAWYLSCHSSLKNYDDTIEKFCDWIGQYVGESDGAIVGEREFEYADDATMLMLSRGRLLDIDPSQQRSE